MGKNVCFILKILFLCVNHNLEKQESSIYITRWSVEICSWINEAYP